MTGVDWADENQMVSQYFSVKEALLLHQWNRLATDSDGLTDDIKESLFDLCAKLDDIRDFIGCPMNVHCMYRSPAYNKLIGAPANDVHSLGQAVDFDCGSDLSIDEVHEKLLPVLEQYGIRMEQNTPTWVHIDIHPVGINRYFLA